jgi:hypothetical protein
MNVIFEIQPGTTSGGRSERIVKMWNMRLFILMVIVLPLHLYGQGLTEEQKQHVIVNLESRSWDSAHTAIRMVINYNITEAIPTIETEIWKKRSMLKFDFLEALVKLRSPRAERLAYKIIDSSGIYATSGNVEGLYHPDSLYLRFMVTRILINGGIYSTVPYVFEMMENSKIAYQIVAQDQLKAIYEHVPSFADSAISVLTRMVRESPSTILRIKSFNDLIVLTGPEIVGLCIDRFLHDPDDSTWGNLRIRSLELLFKYNYAGLHDLLLTRLPLEPDLINRSIIADSLLSQYSRPIDLKVVKNYILLEADTIARKIFQYKINDFIPRRPNDTIGIKSIIDTLTADLTQAKAFSWITDENLFNQLDSILTISESSISVPDSINCSRAIRLFQQKADSAARNTTSIPSRTINSYAWKFLHYNAQYILDRLPKPK